jgi:hypothetical protein
VPGIPSQKTLRQRKVQKMAIQRPRSSQNVFFSYIIPFTGLISGGTAQNSLTLAKDVDFIVTKLSQFSDVAAAGQTASTRILPLVKLQITDTSNNIPLFNDFTPIPALFGDGSIPYILPTPYVFPYNGSVNFSMQNYDATQTYNVYLILSGYKVY